MTLPDCLSIDPGPETCGVVLIADGVVRYCEDAATVDFTWAHISAQRSDSGPILIESLSNYGSPVGDETLRTAYAIGKLAAVHPKRTTVIKRLDVKYALLGSPKGTDSVIRQNILERFGGPAAAKKGGPLAMVRGHSWAALALAVAWSVMLENGNVKSVRMP